MLDQVDKDIAQSNTCSLDDIQRRRKLKEELDELYRKKEKGYQIRSRAKYVEDGERSKTYFVGLEKQRQSYNCISSLKNANGQYVHSDKEILDTARQYYSKLYRNKSPSADAIQMFFESVVPEKQLDEEMRGKCEGEFTLGECESAINKMKKNKSPCLDGISTEFYEKFWPLIGNLLVDVFNHSCENEILSDSQRTAVFTLIYKKYDTNDLSNYRPTSLTNVDYRIMAFVLATRLQLVIDSIINHDQTAYIKKR